MRIRDWSSDVCSSDLHVGDLDRVELSVGAGPDRNDLLLHRVRRVLRLLEQLCQTRTAGQLAPGCSIQIAREHRERLERAVLGELELERAGDLLEDRKSTRLNSRH